MFAVEPLVVIWALVVVSALRFVVRIVVGRIKAVIVISTVAIVECCGHKVTSWSVGLVS